MARNILLALGGNAILPAGNAGTIQEQRRITRESLMPLAELVDPRDRLVLTHGNGPIVGNILLRNEAASAEIPPMPLDICGADSQGGIGYMIVQCLHNAFQETGKDRPVAGLVTRVRVEAEDPALVNPTKPIGPFYSQEQARHFAAANGWNIVEDAGRGWRRVVGSPMPQEVLELASIRSLLEAGHVVVAAGGGGIPVIRLENGGYHGVEAVIDKDHSSALLASSLGLETMVIVTSVTHICVGYGTPRERRLTRLSAEEARGYLEAGEFPQGSMGPKVEAALSFLARGGKEVLITSPEELGAALRERSGTRIQG